MNPFLNRVQSWGQFLLSELKMILTSKNPLLWSVLAMWVAGAFQTELSNFRNNAGVMHITISIFNNLMILICSIVLLRWRWKYTYVFLAVIALLFLGGATSIVYLYAVAFQQLQTSPIQPFLIAPQVQSAAEHTYLIEQLILSSLVDITSLLVIFFSCKYMLSSIKMEKKYKKISTRDLLRMHFEANQVLWALSKMQKQPTLIKIARDANRDAGWSQYELARREPHAVELIKGMANKDNDARNKVANQIMEKYGTEVLVPLATGWDARTSHYFSSQGD